MVIKGEYIGLLIAVWLLSIVHGQDTPNAFREDKMLLEQGMKGINQHVRYILSSITDEDWTRLDLHTYSGITRLVETSLQASAAEISESCTNSTQEIIPGIIGQKLWALQLVDAFGKPASSLLRDARFGWLGSYSECIEITTESMDPPPFNGQYCLAYVPFEQQGAITILKLGTCFPDTCNTTEVTSLFKNGLSTLASLLPQLNLNVSIEYSSVDCKDPGRPLDTKAIVCIALQAAANCRRVRWNYMSVMIFSVIVGIILCLVVAGTLFDVINLYLKKVEAGDEEHIPLIKCTEEPPGLCIRLLMAFSAYSNLNKLLSTEQSSGSLNCVHGIRFLSMTWVILGHTLQFSIATIGGPGNIKDLFDYLKRWTVQVMVNATVSVDTFFVLSGLLVGYLTLREMDRRKGKINWIMFYLHRYIRLTPTYMLILMVYVCVSPYLGQGPQWNEQSDPACADNWWTNLLYINNLVDSSRMCMAWSWYLANDMQFYILSPIFMLLLFKYRRIGIVAVCFFVLVDLITRGVVSNVNWIGPAGFTPVKGTPAGVQPDQWNNLYIRPWTRISPYLVGVFTGYLLHKTNCKIKMHRGLNLLGWSIATFFCVSTLYGLFECYQGNYWSNDLSAFYNSTFRFAWALGVAWVIFACCSGYGGYVNSILSWKALIPLSRLTYCAYLVHPVIMMWYFGLNEALVMVSISNLIYFFFGNLMATYCIALVCSLLFESTVLGIEKVLLGKFR